MNVEALIPRWLRKDEEEWSMSDEVIVPPPIARLPDPPPQTDEEKRLATIATAHVYVEQLRQERATDRAEIEQLRADLAEVNRLLQSEQRKSGLLELDIVQQANNLQTLQTDLLEKDRCLSLLRQVLDKFGTKAPPKKDRTPRPKKKADRESATETAEAIG